MVTASFPLCLTQGVHPNYSRSFAFIRGPIDSLEFVPQAELEHARIVFRHRNGPLARDHGISRDVVSLPPRAFRIDVETD